MPLLTDCYQPIRDYIAGKVLTAWPEMTNKLMTSDDPINLTAPVARIALESVDRLQGEGTPRSDRYRMSWRIGAIWPKHATTPNDLYRIEKAHALQSILLANNHPGNVSSNPQIESLGVLPADEMDNLVELQVTYTVDIELARGN